MSTTTEDLTRPQTSSGWRVVDIVVAAILGIAIGVIFWAYNMTIARLWDPLEAVTPGFAGLLLGVWLLGGVLGGLVIRKPGAALLVEVLAATVSVLPGNQWGITTLYSGLAQGLGAELIFAIFAWRRWNASVAVLAGIGSAVGAFVYEYLYTNHAMGLTYNLTYLVCMLISGAVLAGGLSWLLMKALAQAGALDRFEAGREARRTV